MRFDSIEQFEAWISEILPGVSVEEDNEGQIILYTGLSNDGDNGVIPTEET